MLEQFNFVFGVEQEVLDDECDLLWELEGTKDSRRVKYLASGILADLSPPHTEMCVSPSPPCPCNSPLTTFASCSLDDAASDPEV